MEPVASAPSQDHRITVVEILGYAGTAIALVGTGAVVGSITSGSKQVEIIVAIAVAAALFAAGLLLGNSAQDRLQRMRSVLWFFSVGAFLSFISALLEPNSKAEFLLILAIPGVVASILWFVSRRTLQQLAMYVLLLTSILVLTIDVDSFVPLAAVPPDITVTAVALLLIGVVWLALGVVGTVEPARTTRVLGSITVLLGAFWLSVENQEVAYLVVMLFGAALLAIGNMRSDRATGGIGIVGLLFGTAALFGSIVEGDSVAIISLVIGTGVVILAIILGRSWGQVSAQLPPVNDGGMPPPPPPPPSGTPAQDAPPPGTRPPDDMWSG